MNKLVKIISINAIGFLFLCFASALFLEVVLRFSTWFDQENSPHPIYIPHKFQLKHRDINNTGYLDKNGFRTNHKTDDLINDLKSTNGCKVVILGDSFVWGAGLYPDKRWSSVLEQTIKCKVFPFGKNGWTSLEAFQFYDEKLRNIKFEYLIVGLVSNDTHPRGKFKLFDYTKDPALQLYVSFKSILGIPDELDDRLRERWRSYDFLDQIIGNTINGFIPNSGSLANKDIVSYGYSKWEDRMFEPDVFDAWVHHLKVFKQSCNHDLGFLVTPTDSSFRSLAQNRKFASALNELELVYYNSFDDQKELLGEERARAYWANLADGHPGEAQAVVYAKGAKELMAKMGYFD